MATWAVTFEVEGSGTFPLDMLRYDGCYPADSTAVEMIGELPSMERLRKVRRVKLASVNERKDWKPTIDRWRSFGWAVAHLSAPHKIGG